MTKISWSHSALDTYVSCPKKYYHIRVAKDVVGEQGPEAAWGEEVHKALELFVTDGKPLPANMKPYEPLAETVRDLPGDGFAELKLAMTEQLQPVEWSASDAWGRGIVDLVKVNGTHASVVDYKTGKSKYGTKGQDARSAVLVFVGFPEVQTISTGWVYLKESHIIAKTFERDQIPALLAPTIKIVRDLEWSHEHGNWQARPSGLCNGWCPVKSCKHWRQKT